MEKAIIQNTKYKNQKTNKIQFLKFQIIKLFEI